MVSLPKQTKRKAMSDQEIIYDAMALFLSGQRLSVNFLREHYGIGYSRAKRLKDQLDYLIVNASITHNIKVGNGQTLRLYNKEIITPQSFVDAIRALDIKPIKIESKIEETDHFAVINIADAHIGNHKTNEIVDRYQQAIVWASHRVQDAFHVIYVIGNDFLHIDNLQGTTTKGTNQETEVNVIEAYRIGLELQIDMIRFLAQRFNVTVVPIAGNHDYTMSHILGITLQKFFPKIVLEPSFRTYMQIDDVGLMFAHGNNIKQKDFPLVFASERPDIWGKAKRREILIGHFHHTKRVDFVSTEFISGTTVRYFPTLTYKTTWEKQKGYTSPLSAMALMYTKDGSEVVTYEKYWT